MNALKHGLTAARAILVGDESEADLESMKTGFAAAKTPFDAVEAYMVNTLTHEAWRIQRSGRLEAELFEWAILAEEEDHQEAVTAATMDVLPTELMAEASSLTQTDEGEGVPRRQQGQVDANRKLRLASAFVRLSSGEDLLGKMLRYRGEAQRSFFKTMNALERLQRQRQGDHVEAPLAVDIDIESGPVPGPGQPDPHVRGDESRDRDSRTDPLVKASGEKGAEMSADVADPQQPAGAPPEESVETPGTDPETKPTPATEDGSPPAELAPSSPAPGAPPPATASRRDSGPPLLPRFPETNPIVDARLARMEREMFR